MNTKSLNCLVDSDYLVYRIGFAVKDDEPLEYALATVRTCLHNIKDRFPDQDWMRLFLSGEGNFREQIAKHQVYKGNRDPSLKPKFYTEIKQYMFDHWNAERVNGMEAEDACGIEQYASKDKDTVIVGVDKDLMCVPGWHYNPIKDVLVYQTLADANQWFWLQVLMGDRVDNIRGIDGIGPKTAAKLIEPCEKDWMKMHDVVLKEYIRQHGEEGESIMRETAKLVWILRKENETYDGSRIN